MDDKVEIVAFVFDGPPLPPGPRFIETELLTGEGVGVGSWKRGDDGTWALLVPVPSDQIRRPPFD